MTAQYGAHEVMELHEVLTGTIDGINQFELYRPYITDQSLSLIIDKQINFLTQEYNNMVNAFTQKGMTQIRPYDAPINSQPIYGLDNPKAQSPNSPQQRLDNKDIASGMLGYHKSSAILKSMASLECADLTLRRMVQQGSINCSEMAYEVWQYMNQNGYYQVPTMKQMTTETMMRTYTPMSTMPNISNVENIGNQENAYSNHLNTMTGGMDYTGSLNGMDGPNISNITPVGSYQ